MTTPADLAAAASMLMIDPGLGCVLRGRPGPGRDAFLARVKEGLPPGTPWRKVPIGVGEDRLLGGLDLAATLAAGKPVVARGLLAEAHGGVLLLAAAERLAAGAAAQLAAALDTGHVTLERDGFSAALPARCGMIALDEGLTDESPPAALLDRLALCVSGDEAGPGEPQARAQAALDPAGVMLPDSIAAALTQAAMALGIASLRPVLLALRAARAAAAGAGRAEVADEDIAIAVRLVLAPRATRLPEPAPPEPEQAPETVEPSAQAEPTGPMADSVVEAVLASLPPDMLARLGAGAAMRSNAGGAAGQVRKQATRGRPIGSRPGLPRGGARLHVLDTLRVAAPWQRLRGGAAGRLVITRGDFRIRRFRENTRTTFIFAVDASGSAALARLAEAKGAVELLLAECYIRRDRAALLSVRGQAADLLLPPTASLARAKRLLAGMAGGGTTPLAAGLAAALPLAAAIRREGQSPLLVLLTDGRANVALDGSQGRPKAEADALSLAALWRAAGYACVLLDTGARPHPFARKLAEAAGGRYVPLPNANAGTMRAAVLQAAAQ